MEKHDDPDGQRDPADIADLLAGLAADPVAEMAPQQVTALFAAALADEPPPGVTVESVLNAARGTARNTVRSEKRSASRGFGAWLTSGSASLKWAGGLVAAAAVIGAVIVVAPTMNQGGTATSQSLAGAGQADAAAGEAAGSAGSAESSSSEAAAGSPEAAGSVSVLDAPGDGAGDTGSEQDRAASGAESSSGDQRFGIEQPSLAAAAPMSAQVTAEPSAGPAPSGQLSSQPGSQQRAAGSSAAGAVATSSGVYCPLPPLTDSEWSAAVSGLPNGVAVRRPSGALCAGEALRGNGIEIDGADGQPTGYLGIVVARSALGRDGADSVSTVVSVTRGDLTVRVIANPSAVAVLTKARLQAIAAAVAAAN